jgi:hypothetical protein
MSERRYVRFIAEVEVEVVDETALKAARLEHASVTDEGVILRSGLNWDWMVATEVSSRLARLSHEHPEVMAAIGVDVFQVSGVGRPRDEDGNYLPFEMMAMPGRDDDTGDFLPEG